MLTLRQRHNEDTRILGGVSAVSHTIERGFRTDMLLRNG